MWSENKQEKGQIRWRMEKKEKGLTEMDGEREEENDVRMNEKKGSGKVRRKGRG